MSDRPPEPRDGISWRAALLEATFVVLGVVLALAANEWREARALGRQADAALETLRQELTTNRAAVAEALDYHLGLTQQLRALSASGEEPEDHRLFARGYVAPADLHHTAWDVAGATGVLASMPYEDVLVLSGIYEAQREYDEQSREAGHLIFAKLFDEGHVGMLRNHENLTLLIGTFWYQECAMLTRYDSALGHLGDDSERAVPDICSWATRSREAPTESSVQKPSDESSSEG